MFSLHSLKRPFFVLAPMDDVTDTVLRQIVADCSPPDLFCTEFVNVDGLQSKGRDKLLHRLDYTAKERPLIAQIWGKNPENYEKTAKELVAMGFHLDFAPVCDIALEQKDEDIVGDRSFSRYCTWCALSM